MGTRHKSVRRVCRLSRNPTAACQGSPKILLHVRIQTPYGTTPHFARGAPRLVMQTMRTLLSELRADFQADGACGAQASGGTWKGWP